MQATALSAVIERGVGRPVGSGREPIRDKPSKWPKPRGR